MNSFKKFNMLALATLITSSLFVACSDEISETTADNPYTANTGNIKSAGTAVDLGLPSGTLWANMNVGATSESDNGILFVWGDATGTQLLPTTSTSYTDVTGSKSELDLFNLYKKSEMSVGYINDTINVYKDETKPLLSPVDYANIDDIIKDIFDKVKDGDNGKLIATVTSGETILCYCEQELKAGGEYKHVDNPAFGEDPITISEEDGYSIVVNKIVPTEVKYYENVVKNDYTEVKDVFGANTVANEYMGGDITTAVYTLIADAKHDPATANWGGNWKMPTADQIRELMTQCKWEYEGNGYRVTGSNGNSIFLPAAGYRYGDKVYGNGNAGYYASGEISGAYHFPSMAEQVKGSNGSLGTIGNMPSVLIFQNGQFANSVNIYSNLSTSYGFSIRPVQK